MAISFSPGAKLESFGNYFIVGLHGTTLSDQDKEMLATLRPLGILIYKRNIEQNLPYEAWWEKLNALVADAGSYMGRNKFFVTIDHEGGDVVRTPPPITRFPFAMNFARRAAEVGAATAIELASMGMNLSWAPVADIHSNPANPVIGKRAFGTTAEQVMQAVVPYAKALAENGILACAKHFPGHGDTSSDSHHELPYLNFPESQLRTRELLPFRSLVNIDVPFIMTAHVMFTAIDPDHPATLSEKILKRILREEWGYKGIVIADDISMAAVAARFGQPEGGATALHAGCDMFIVARHPDGSKDDAAVLAATYLYEQHEQKKLSDDVLYEAFLRIERVYDEKLVMQRPWLLDPELLERHAELARETR